MKLRKLALVALGLSAITAIKQPVRADDAPATGAAPSTAAPAPSTDAPATAAPVRKRGGLKALEADLGLTDDQVAKIKPIWKDAEEQQKALKDDTTLTPQDKRAKRKAIVSDRDDKINAILTPDQQQKWADIKAEAKEKKAAG